MKRSYSALGIGRMALAMLALVMLMTGSACGQVPPNVGWCTPQPPEGVEGPLALVACLPANQFEPGEPITVFIGFANISDEPALVRARLDIGTYLFATLTTANGEEVPVRVREPGHFGPDTTDVILPPHGLYGRKLDLLCDPGGYRPSGAPCFVQFPIDEPGDYRLSFSYEHRCGIAGCPDEYPWVGTLESRTLELRLEEQ